MGRRRRCGAVNDLERGAAHEVGFLSVEGGGCPFGKAAGVYAGGARLDQRGRKGRDRDERDLEQLLRLEVDSSGPCLVIRATELNRQKADRNRVDEAALAHSANQSAAG